VLLLQVGVAAVGVAIVAAAMRGPRRPPPSYPRWGRWAGHPASVRPLERAVPGPPWSTARPLTGDAVHRPQPAHRAGWRRCGSPATAQLPRGWSVGSAGQSGRGPPRTRRRPSLPSP